MQRLRWYGWWLSTLVALCACNAFDAQPHDMGPHADDRTPQAGVADGAGVARGRAVPRSAVAMPIADPVMGVPVPPTVVSEPNSTPQDASQPVAVPGTGLPACPLAQQRGVCETSRHFELQELFRAAELGEGAELLAVDGHLLLARDPEGLSLLIEIPVGFDGPLPSTVHMLPAGYGALDVIEAIDAAFVLACRASADGLDEACTLFGLRGDLVEMPGASVPAGFEPSALTHGPGIHIDNEGRSMPCALGRGIACYTGEGWDMLLESEDAVVSATLQSPVLAVTADARALLEVAPRVFREEPALAGGSLRWVDPLRDGAGMLVEPDEWASVDQRGEVTRCALGEQFEQLRALTAEPRLLGVTATQHLVHVAEGEVSAWCDERALPDGPVIDVAIAGCGIGINPRVLTPQVLLGSTFCAID